MFSYFAEPSLAATRVPSLHHSLLASIALTPKSEPRPCLPTPKAQPRPRRNKCDEFEEYGPEILDQMLTAEMKAVVDPTYMREQPELSWAMRQTLIVWLIQVHGQYNLQPETLYLTINIIDRISSVRSVTKEQYQLIGTTALWVAAKYEENHGRVPTLKNLSFVCSHHYRESDFLQTERLILRLLNFDLGHPTPEAFLRTFHAETARAGDSRTVELGNAQVHSIARYLMEIGTVAAPDGFFVKRRPSVLATGSLHLAEIIFRDAGLPNSGVFTKSHIVKDSARDPRIIECVHVLSGLLGKGCAVIRDKYATKAHHEASHIVFAWVKSNAMHAARTLPTQHYRQLYGSHPQQHLHQQHHQQSPHANLLDGQYPSCPAPGLLTPPKDMMGWGSYTPVHV